jgi:hypothetical protein
VCRTTRGVEAADTGRHAVLPCKEQVKYRSGGMLWRSFLVATLVCNSLAPLVKAVEPARAASPRGPVLHFAEGS